ncbi:MAG TPA: NTP transferase domain-containing protein [Candidatus Limnocylindrales bacterium]|nr:NTP transferase domain-containing protein [Candidatus Limnocylindrales bacterium]
MTLTGIVLAGGRSSRFGSDKLAAPMAGSTILGATVGVLASLADGVIVAGAALPDGFVGGDVPVALVPDHEPFAGPLVALAGVLATSADDPDDVAIVAAGDMPRLVPAVLHAMVAALQQRPTVEAVWLGLHEATIDRDDAEPPRRQVLPLAIRVQPAARASREAVEAGQRSLQALVDRMAAIELPFAAWSALDPEEQTLLDVDTPGDLDRLRSG